MRVLEQPKEPTGREAPARADRGPAGTTARKSTRVGLFAPGLLPTELWEYSFRDFVRGLIAALRPSSRDPGLSLPGLKQCIPARSARVGIIAALRALDLPAGARIGVPLYCCPVVFKAIVAAGHRPHFIDVERSSLCMSPEDLALKCSQIHAVIPVHMFGNVCDMPRLVDAAQGRPVIEDCAQALGSRLNGSPVGSFGSIGVFSFRSGKYLSVGEGAAVVSGDPSLYSRLQQEIARMPVPTRKQECLNVGKTYLKSALRSRPLYGVIGYRLWALYNKKTDYTAMSPIVVSQIYTTDLAVTVRRLEFLSSAIDARRSNAAFYARALNQAPEMLCSETPDAFFNRYQFPIIYPSAEIREFVTSYLRRRGIDPASPYKDIAEVAAAHYGYAGDCPVAERIARAVLTIPNHHRLSHRHVSHIARCVSEAWAKVGPRVVAGFRKLTGD